VIAVGSVLTDRLLMELLERIFETPPLVKCGFFAAVTTGFFWFGLFLRRKYPHRTYSNEAVFFSGFCPWR